MQMNAVFPSSVGIDQQPKFLREVRTAAKKWIDSSKQKYQIDPIYPVAQSENMVHDENIIEFKTHILNKAAELLDQQGYDVSKVDLYLGDLWCQEHHKGSGHERHTHNNGAIVSGFYFLECPENSAAMMLYDPRSGKDFGFVLPEKDEKQMTEASNIINYMPTEGELVLVNSYVPHGFTKNRSDKPFVFLHLNVYAQFRAQAEQPKMIAKTTYGSGAIVV